MLAPGAELGAEDSALARFAHASRHAWNGFAEALEAASGIDIGFREDGALLAAGNAMRAAALKAVAAKTGDTWLDIEAARAREPLLSRDLLGALFVAQDAQADNRALGTALTEALQRLGVAVHENCPVQSLAVVNDRAAGVVTPQGMLTADAVVLACGAWMNLIPGLPENAVPSIHPVKGQMLALTPPAGTALPKALIWGDDVYLIPRRDRLIVGATVEDAGFDISVNQEGRDMLLAAATRVLPSLREWTLSETWAGLRPRTADHAPVLGPTMLPGLHVAGGQFRNGILFAPLIGETVASLVLGREPACDISAFDPKRFTR
jgi:glycine oxidase